MKKSTIEARPALARKKKVFDKKSCAITAAMDVLDGKWKILIIGFIQHYGVGRFGQLKDAIPGLTQAVLTKQLRELEMDGVIRRTLYAEVPPRVEYRLTELGEQLETVSEQLRNWGQLYLDRRSKNMLPVEKNI